MRSSVSKYTSEAIMTGREIVKSPTPEKLADWIREWSPIESYELADKYSGGHVEYLVDAFSSSKEAFRSGLTSIKRSITAFRES
jgi:hypothetical protein